jgi:hypothetical protein
VAGKKMTGSGEAANTTVSSFTWSATRAA